MILTTKFKWQRIAVGMCLLSLTSMVFASTEGYIDNLIRQAISSHPLIGSARAEQQATSESVRAAKLNLLPAPSLSSGYDRDDGMVSRLQVRQSLWTGGKLTANINQARFDDKAATEYVYEQQNQVAKTTIEAWRSYITAVSKQRVYYDNLQLLAEFEEMMQRRVEQGVSARIEMDLVTNRILQEQNAYQGAVAQQRIAKARLQQITGRNLTTTDLPVPDLAQMVNQAKTATQAFEQMAFDQSSFYNPTVVKAQYQVEAAKQEVKSLQAARYPTLYAQYGYDYYHEDDDKDDDGEFSIGLSYEPGAGLSNLALARASSARVGSLSQSKEAARRQVLEDIQTQYQKFISAQDQERSLIAAVAGAQIVVSSYRRQFIAGRKSWLEVLNAVREHSQYQDQLVETRASIIGAYYQLQVDFGRMSWQQFDQSRQPEPLFSPLDPVKNWFARQDTSIQSSEQSTMSPIIKKPDTIKTYPITNESRETLRGTNATKIVAIDNIESDIENGSADMVVLKDGLNE